MNLGDLNGDIHIPKPWLNIVCNTCSSLFGTYMNGGFPCSFMNFSQVEDSKVVQTTPTSIILSPIAAPNYGSMSFPILSSGMQILVTMPCILSKTSGSTFRLGLYLNNVLIVQFQIVLAAFVSVPGQFTIGISYDDENFKLNCYIWGTFSGTSSILVASEVDYVSGDNNDFDIRGNFTALDPANSITALSMNSQTYGLFNSEE